MLQHTPLHSTPVICKMYLSGKTKKCSNESEGFQNGLFYIVLWSHQETPQNLKKLVLLLTSIWRKKVFSWYNQWIEFSLTVFLVQSLLCTFGCCFIFFINSVSLFKRYTNVCLSQIIALKEYLQLKAFPCQMCLKGSSQLLVMDEK